MTVSNGIISPSEEHQVGWPQAGSAAGLQGEGPLEFASTVYYTV